MSLNTMKRKTAAKLNLSGKGPKQTWMSQGPHGKSVTHVISTGFSLNGGHRNIGRVGQTNLGRSVTRTPFRGNAPMGNGGSNGKYPIVISNSGSCCTNKSDLIKPSSLNTKGMLARKYKWLNGGGTDHHGNPAHNPVKPDDNYPENFSQSSYIQSKASTAAITSIVNDGGDKSCLAIGGKCGHHIGGKYYQRNMYYKNPSQPLDYAQYKLFLSRKSLRNCAYCENKKLCPPGSCPTCKGHYDSTAGASIESPEFDVRLGLSPCATCSCPTLYTPGSAIPLDILAAFNKALCEGKWTIGADGAKITNVGGQDFKIDFSIASAPPCPGSSGILVYAYPTGTTAPTSYKFALQINGITPCTTADYPFYNLPFPGTAYADLLVFVKENCGLAVAYRSS